MLGGLCSENQSSVPRPGAVEVAACSLAMRDGSPSTHTRALSLTHTAVWDAITFSANGLVFLWSGIAAVNYTVK